MRFAKQQNIEMAEAKPGNSATCYGCGEAVFAKCGPILGWHWCHKSGSQCVHASTEPETLWHSGWKSEVPKEFREVTIKKSGRPNLVDMGDFIARVVPHVTNCGQRFQAIVMPAERMRHAVKTTCDDTSPDVAWFLLDTATDWMTNKRASTARRKSISKGNSIQEFCPHVGDLKRYHIEWLAERTDRGSVDYYAEGY